MAEAEGLTLSSVGLSSARVATANKYVSSLSLADLGPYRVSNYSLPNLTQASDANRVTIDAKELMITGITATGTSKAYDGSTAVSALAATVSLDGFLAGESAPVTVGAAIYNSKNVLGAYQINLSNLSLGSISGSTSGTVASDYTINTTSARSRSRCRAA